MPGSSLLLGHSSETSFLKWVVYDLSCLITAFVSVDTFTRDEAEVSSNCAWAISVAGSSYPITELDFSKLSGKGSQDIITGRLFSLFMAQDIPSCCVSYVYNILPLYEQPRSVEAGPSRVMDKQWNLEALL